MEHDILFKKITKYEVERYLENDYLLPIIEQESKLMTEDIQESKQFKNMLKHSFKRAMFHYLYGDLSLNRVLDVGGAYCGYPKLIEKNEYQLLEPNKIFDQTARFQHMQFLHGNFEKIVPDKDACFDAVVCGDVFLSDNARLNEFIIRYLPVCKQLRFSLTFRYFHNGQPMEKYAGWTLQDLNMLLMTHCAGQGRNDFFTDLTYENDGYLPDERNVYVIFMKGDRYGS